MTKDDLIGSLKKINPPSHNTAEEFAEKIARITATVNQRMKKRTDVVKLVGEDNLLMMEDNHNNHARMMENLLYSFNAEALVETVLWVFKAYQSRGFHPLYWSAQLNTWDQVFKEELTPASYREVTSIYQWLIINIPNFNGLTEQSDSNR